MPKLAKWNQWFAGMTNDEYMGPKGSYYNGQGIEHKINSRQISLFNNTPTTAEINTRTVGDVISIIPGNYPKAGYFCYDGWVQSPTKVGTDFHYKTTKIMANAVVVPTSGSLKVLMISTDGTIDRFDYDPTVDGVGVTGTVTVGFVTNVPTGGAERPVLIDNGIVYIGAGNKVYALDIASWTGSTVLTLDYGYNVVSFSKIGDLINIFTRSEIHGKQYYWDGVTTTVERSIVWYDKPIMNTANLNNVDYVITGAKNATSETIKRALYVANGYQPTMLYQSGFMTANTNKFNFIPSSSLGLYTNAIETIQNRILVPSYGCIYEYGFYTPGLQPGISKIITFTGAFVSAMSFVEGINNNLYYAYNNGTSKIVAIQNLYQNYGASGYVETNPILLDVEASTKKLKVVYKLPHSSTGIKIYSKINDGNYTQIAYINGGDAVYFNKRKHVFMYNANFYKIQFKFELLSSNPLYTPILSNVSFIYDEIKDDFT